MTDVVLPDPRRVRRAVRWGVVRTAGGAVGWVFGILVFLSVAGMVFDAALGHQLRFEMVVGRAFVASQPDYSWDVINVDTAAPFTYGNTMHASGTLRTVNPGSATTAERRLHQNALGHLGYVRFGSSKGLVTAALERGRPTHSQTDAVLAELPAHATAIAIVELRQSYDWNGRAPLFFPSRLPALGDLVWLEPPYPVRTFEGSVVRHPLTWTQNGDSFADWAHRLRDSDARNLKPFGLPTIQEIRLIARSPGVYAYLTQPVEIATLAGIARRPDVSSVRLVDVRLPLG